MNRMVTTVEDALEWAKSGDMNCGPQTEAAVKIMAAELSRLRGAAVPFKLTEPELTAFRQWDCNERMGDAALLAGALRRCMDDLEFAQEQHQAACDRASEFDMRACVAERDLATALGLLKFAIGPVSKWAEYCNEMSMRVEYVKAEDWLVKSHAFLAAHKEVQR